MITYYIANKIFLISIALGGNFLQRVHMTTLVADEYFYFHYVSRIGLYYRLPVILKKILNLPNAGEAFGPKRIIKFSDNNSGYIKNNCICEFLGFRTFFNSFVSQNVVFVVMTN